MSCRGIASGGVQEFLGGSPVFPVTPGDLVSVYTDGTCTPTWSNAPTLAMGLSVPMVAAPVRSVTRVAVPVGVHYLIIVPGPGTNVYAVAIEPGTLECAS